MRGITSEKKKSQKFSTYPVSVGAATDKKASAKTGFPQEIPETLFKEMSTVPVLCALESQENEKAEQTERDP